MRYFGKEARSEELIKENELDINGLLWIDDWTLAIEGFPNPFIVCCFISNNLIFVALYHNYYDKHYHFIYDTQKREMVGEKV
jgi:hypothetical protein